MIDEKLLDQMNFGELNQSLEYVIEKIDEYDGKRSEGEDSPVLDLLCVVANKIIRRMDRIVREFNNPEALAQWNKAMEGYEERFEKYTDFFLEDDTLIDLG